MLFDDNAVLHLCLCTVLAITLIDRDRAIEINNKVAGECTLQKMGKETLHLC